MPLNGAGTVAQLADIINTGYFAWLLPTDTSAGGPEPRSWQSPANISVDVSALPTDEANLVKQALALWQDVANVTFSYTTGTANITYTDSGPSARTTSVTSLDASGDRWITSATVNVPRNWTTGIGTGIANGVNSSYFQTLVHETGHALGLGHSGHYDGGGPANSFYNTDSTIYANDTWRWSIMSYNDQTQYGGGTLLAVITPQIADIAAIQATYGAATTRTGDTIYGYNSNGGYDFHGGAPSLTIYDSGGNDTLNCSGFGVAQTIDLRAGNFSSIGGAVNNVCIYTNVVIENAIGGFGADTIYGNDVANTIDGSDGADTIDGGAGADTMSGGKGDDTFLVDNVLDVVNENAGEGYDYVKCTATSYTLGANIERLNYLGDPNANFTGIGNALDNHITGWNGADYLDGRAGADTLEGFAGDDTYEVDNVNDVIIESANAGYDYVRCAVTSYTLGANVEKLNYVGNPTSDFTGTGNALDNLIIGWSGNDTLDGAAGADTMQGLSGNDTYTVDNVGDVVQENVNSGYDYVLCYITSYTLGANVEKLNYLGSNSTANFTGIGNALDNYIIGWNGSDYIDGGAGADTLEGFAGNDNYFVDNAGDVIIETANAGSDTVYATVDFTLNANVENLVMQGSAGLQGYGNALANAIYGNSGNNTLDGKAGADLMVGAAGNDSYFVDNAGDVITENAGEGSDTVYATASLHLGANIENLVMQGSADLQGFGNTLANAIYGNTGNNILDGDVGADLMVGGAGNDAYYVDNAGDVITENANEGTDTVYSTAHLRLTANLENLLLQGSADLQGYGNSLSNAIYGNSGNNLLDGDVGANSMYGGAGNDTYYVDNIADVVVENANEGNDTVHTTANLALAANCETLILDGSAGLQGYGNALSNSIYGNSGDNLLDGGAGGDSMYGGAGNDTYYVDNTGDVIVENANQGTDTVFSSVDLTLAANVEQLVMQGSAGLQGYGNSLSNALYGNSGANLLNGGAGADSLTGNAGNDTFIFNAGQASGDTVVDFAGNGAASGDSFLFVGFGTAAQGASFTQIGSTNQWQIYSGLDAHDETITITNNATVHPSDFLFS